MLTMLEKNMDIWKINYTLLAEKLLLEKISKLQEKIFRR